MLTILKISLAKLLHKPFNSALSVLLFAIGVALISLIIKAETFINNQYQDNLAGIDLVVGAKGSPLQLILSSVLHADVPTGNIALDEVEKIRHNPLVKQTIPISLGDSYKGFRIVGTHVDYLSLYACSFNSGKEFIKPLDAVIGANVAEKTSLKVGDTFTGVHGFMTEGHSHDDFRYTVTGILIHSGNVTDNLILTPTESVWMVHGEKEEHHARHEHEHDTTCEHEEHHENGHDEHCNHNEHEDEAWEHLQEKLSHGEELTEEEAQLYNEKKGELVVAKTEASQNITALLVFYKNPQAAVTLPRAINQNTNMQAASPVIEMNRLISLIGGGLDTVRLLAWIIIIISALNIFIYLLNLFNQSVYEIVLIRLAGASRLKVLALLYFQGMFLAISGWVLGIVVSNTTWFFLPQFTPAGNLLFGILQQELMLLCYCIGIGLLAAFIPALKAYRNNIHFILSR